MSKIVIGITGGIAAYKVCDVISQLFQRGFEIRVVLSNHSQKFITPLTVATLSRHRAYTDGDFWCGDNPRPLHIALGEWADLILIAPLTAHTVAKLAHGMGDDLLCNTILASRCPVVLAPAMNPDMWHQQSVQRNWELLLTDQRYHPLGMGSGLLACDRRGLGRMAEPMDIIQGVECISWHQGQRDLAGIKIIITAGGTREGIDRVRFIGNPATGKMGVALALACSYRGAEVTVIHGVMEQSLMERLSWVKTIAVTSAKEMEQVLGAQFPQADWLIMAAAVGDLQPQTTFDSKLPKAELPLNLALEYVPDLVGNLSLGKKAHQTIIGFAAQGGDIVTPAQDKLKRKGLDFIVANPIDQPDAGFGSDRNQAIVLDRHHRQFPIAPCSKLAMAEQIIDIVLGHPRAS